jgi:putative Holliday junction resolvase
VRKATRLLGVDYGSVRIGLAVSDPDRKIAFPLVTYERQGGEKDAAYFRVLAIEEAVGGVVVGLPVHLDGREGVKAREARAFGHWLAEICRSCSGMSVSPLERRNRPCGPRD